ncbi:hypothetical protein OSB04_006478 [Centaurea solstitialis]|uniref:C2 domain-containing protein n=1 Tax=Centaurea solstitialis TaxID=347529 RepID=A0AA38TQL1_9ASTR|nr:hypothetical protein OSB04_006478 [Centaurea solstitialis]
MSNSIHGSLLEVTVVSCTNLKDTEWISRQDPYVCVEYGSHKSSTRTCKGSGSNGNSNLIVNVRTTESLSRVVFDGGKNPAFQEKFVYSLVEGLRDLNIAVWNSNTITHDDLIGTGRVPLTKALSQGFDDSSWPLQSKTGRHAGEVRLIMHYSNANKPGKDIYAQKPGKGFAPSAPPYVTNNAPPAYMYGTPPPITSYPPSPYPSYPQNSGVYPAAPYPPQAGAPYPPQAGAPYPPQPYPPNPAPYGSHYPPGSPYPGMYPPPPY